MSVTIKDVAHAAGVSVASVSRALNGHDSVTVQTRERVLAVAKKLRYMPNNAARSLITRRTQTIGALLPDLHGAFFSELIRGIDVAARARGLHLLVSSSHGDAEEAAAALRAMRGRVDGMLVMSPHADADFLADNLPAALPMVLMNACGHDGAHASLSVDNYSGAHAMVRHLVEDGHRRISFIGGPRNNYDAQERLRGYRAAMRELLRQVEPHSFTGDFNEESGHRAGHAALAARPQAIFAANDMMAIGCLAAIHEAGLSVPEDIALAGFDDIPMARYVTPGLTTVRVRIAEIGEQAMAQLAHAVNSPQDFVVSQQVIPTDLVVRESCGCNRVAGTQGRFRESSLRTK